MARFDEKAVFGSHGVGGSLVAVLGWPALATRPFTGVIWGEVRALCDVTGFGDSLWRADSLRPVCVGGSTAP